MNTREFSERCNVSPQIVRLWVRRGKLVRRKDGIAVADGFILLPYMRIGRKSGHGERTPLVKENAGVSGRTILNWLRDGKLVRGADGVLYVREGMELRKAYRPVRRTETGEQMWEEEMVMEEI